MNEAILHFVLGFIAAIIGAVPFGLVNLSVVDSTLNRGERSAFLVSAGATLIEIAFVLLAVFLGSRLAGYIENNQWVELFILVVLLAAGISFFLRRNKGSDKKMFIMPAFFKGMFLNILSVQVLLVIARKINYIIGTIFVGLAVVQLVKILIF